MKRKEDDIRGGLKEERCGFKGADSQYSLC